MQRDDQDHAMSTEQKLVYLANQIATFFASQPRSEQADGIAKHINDYWEPRMRRQFFAVVEAGGSGITPLVEEALPKIKRPAEG
jgi:formate dehydrogenase subunit delta